jgi:glycogen debranching enzyme
VWSHDTAIVIDGMLRAGFAEEAAQVAEGLLNAAEGFDYRLPELFGGHPAAQMWPPVPYAASCRPQAWAATSVIPIARALGALA